MPDKLETSPVCCCTIIHQDVVDQVKEGLLPDSSLGEMAELFKCLGDPTRLKIVYALLAAEMCVCDIGALLEMSTPAISHHLKVLRQLKLVTFRRSGKIVYYTIADEHISPILSQALAHIKESGNG
ncbi:ArsR/SmtB family transcription factor [Desulfovibrio intestinalis]|uniref:ArsR family transcriptional regulator n=1 Tax=Desulfovibrio intestinalis TaxID=58621 RepID=A0A7W8FFU8_9BACT|nr:metalloregulator ArsR/SmtB family transcription factor [Desulfovibrio intestinalis]MBB5144348.1 ArsR family transcriptional regulator [Desulfovibrio intestinalis]